MDGQPGRAPSAGSTVDRHRMVTVADVARQAGVSIPTVSKVVNGRANVSAGTRERVEDVIRTQGYLRRKKLNGRNSTVELVFNRLESQWALEIIRGVQAAAGAQGYGVVVSQTADGHMPNLGWLDDVFSRRSAAVISVSAQISERQREALAGRSVPLVILDPAGEPAHGTPSVRATNWSGGYAAAQHLLDLGHRRIAAITGPDDVPCARARLDGYREALAAAGLTTHDRSRSGNFLVEDGYRLARDLLTGPDGPTAIFAGNDLQAMGVYQAARESAIRIPDDLSVVGFDDLDVAGWMHPRLTTIRQPLRDMAETATGLALALAAGNLPPTSPIEVATELVIRASTAVAPPPRTP